MHVQLKHATDTHLRGYLKPFDLWHDSLDSQIQKVVNSFKCRLSFPSTPHPVLGSSPPVSEAQTHLSIDVVHLEGLNFLHFVDSRTGWSKAGLLALRDPTTQVKVFQRIQVFRHGVPCTVMCVQEVAKGAFQVYCNDIHVRLLPTPADSQQYNGAVQMASGTRQSYYNRFRACDSRYTVSDVCYETTYGKNINQGS